MLETVSAVVQYFDSKGLKYELSDDENVIRVPYTLDNTSVNVYLIFHENDRNVTIKCFEFCKFAEDKKPEMYKTCSLVNAEYKWEKFYVEESDNTITVQDDAIIQADSCGPECYELVARMVSIIDDVFPRFMKTIWQ